MRGQGLIFRNGPESLGRSAGPTRSGEGASALGKRINCPLRAVVVVVVIVIVVVVVIMIVVVIVVVVEMCMDVIDDWRRQEDFTTLLKG
jgi:hypothetical protein